MATTFVAVQCFQCSTMQVKQQKKSNNKWVCAVCGHRQSVRRVHARSGVARDVRQFVQAFNLGRANEIQSIPAIEAVTVVGEEDVGETLKRPRMDWSEYLDEKRVDVDDRDGEDLDVKQDNCIGGQGEWIEPEMVTELMPSRKFRRRCVRSRAISNGQSSCSLNEKSVVPVRAKLQQDRLEEGRKLQDEARIAAPKPRSKWSEYLEESEVVEEPRPSAESKSEGFDFCENCGGFSNIVEEVHPDFL